MSHDDALDDISKVRLRPWIDQTLAVPQQIFSVTSMLTHQERRMLFYLALRHYSGQGAILDMGAFLGGSTICLAAGLAQRAFSRPIIHSYDLFKLGPFELDRFFPEDPPEGHRTRHIFDENLKDYGDLLCVHEGDVLDYSWNEGPIELLFVDIAKSYRVFDHIVTTYFTALIPGRSLVILQDYIFASGPWHHVVMEKLNPYFAYLCDTDVNSALFLLERPIPRDVLEACRWEAISRPQKLELMDAAITRLDAEAKKKHVRGARQLLLEGKDMHRGMQYHRLSIEGRQEETTQDELKPQPAADR